jgi:hypothetical protein
VSRDAAEMAAGWCHLLEAHARRVYSLTTVATVDTAKRVLARIRNGSLPPRFRARDLYRRGWEGIAGPDDAEAILQILEDHGWVRAIEISTTAKGGRSTTEYEAHPLLVGAGKAAA